MYVYYFAVVIFYMPGILIVTAICTVYELIIILFSTITTTFKDVSYSMIYFQKYEIWYRKNYYILLHFLGIKQPVERYKLYSHLINGSYNHRKAKRVARLSDIANNRECGVILKYTRNYILANFTKLSVDEIEHNIRTAVKHNTYKKDLKTNWFIS